MKRSASEPGLRFLMIACRSRHDEKLSSYYPSISQVSLKQYFLKDAMAYDSRRGLLGEGGRGGGLNRRLSQETLHDNLASP